MTLLEEIINASNNPDIDFSTVRPNNYPINFSTDSIFPNLKLASENPNPNPYPLLEPLIGFQISESDLGIVDLNSRVFKKLRRKLKDTHSVSSQSFLEMLTAFLEGIGDKKFGGSVDLGSKKSKGSDYVCKLMEKFGSFVGKDVMGLVIEGCVVLETWDLLEIIIVNKFVDYGLWSDLLFKLMGKSRSNLICLCVRHFSDVKSEDLGGILKYFLSPSKDACASMGSVRKEWESEALAAIERVSDKKLSGEKLGLAEDASMLLMIAYDEFFSYELCLHFVLSSSNVDDVVFSSAISRLDVEQMLGLIRYLGKWLSKHERFPQVGPCPKAVSLLGLKMCQWVPRIEDIVKCLGLVVDEHFSSLSMRSEFHEELKAIEGVVSSLVCEGRSSSSIASLIEILKPEVGDA